jgi:hypothetical protein
MGGRLKPCASGEDVIDPVRGRLGQAPGATARTEATLLTGAGHKLLLGAVSATQTQKSRSEDAAFQKGIELRFDKIGPP